MRIAKVYNHGIYTGNLIEEEGGDYLFLYNDSYQGPPISLTMSLSQKRYEFKKFPPFFDGLLPEGVLLEALLKRAKLDRNDYFGQLITVGHDLVGSVTVEEDLHE